jgi:OOP family OmpA-OmpF porin
MNGSFNKKQIGLAAACALALSILSGAARAQDVSPQTAKDRELVQDTRATVVKSGFGLCWHSGFGPPPASGPECDPNYVAYVEPPVLKAVAVTPPAMAPAPPPAVVAAPEAPPKAYEPPQRPARKDRN